MRVLRRTWSIAFLFFFVHFAPLTYAGAPYRTLDPIPTNYRHIKLYLGNNTNILTSRVVGSAPFLQVNYGLLPNVQIQATIPMTYNHNRGESTHYGLGDCEFAIKYRFITESRYRPQVAIYPIVTTPTGSPPVNLGSGNLRMIYPLTLGKTFGPWLTYGGGGYWINIPDSEDNFWTFGWLVQRTLSPYLTIGTEFLLNTGTPTRETEIGFGVGSNINFSTLHHLLIAWDRFIYGPIVMRVYAAYQLTF